MVDRPRRRINPRDLAQRLAHANVEAMATSMLAGVEQATAARWDAAVARAAALPGDVRPEKIRALTRSFARELGAVGAAAGVAAATPLVGTGATMLAATAELGWFTARSGDLILTIAALHGRPAPTVEERRAWVLAVLIFGSTARQGFTGMANRFGANLPDANAGSGAATSADILSRGRSGRARGGTKSSNNALPIATLRAVNSALSRMIVRKYGTRRGVIAVGTALPLGIGAIVGGGANYMAVRRLAEQADHFFAHLPYSSIETTAIEIGGTL